MVANILPCGAATRNWSIDWVASDWQTPTTIVKRKMECVAVADFHKGAEVGWCGLMSCRDEKTQLGYCADLAVVDGDEGAGRNGVPGDEAPAAVFGVLQLQPEAQPLHQDEFNGVLSSGALRNDWSRLC